MTEHTTHFSGQEWLRYTRHIQQKDIGPSGQLALKNAAVVVVGLGGLGCPVAQYLVAAGVGRLTFVDGDRVALSNLQRQVLYSVEDIGEYKVVAAARRLRLLNPHSDIRSHSQYLLPTDLPLIQDADLVVDCTDNYPSRCLINHLCLQAGVPWCYSGVQDFAAQLAMFMPGKACYQCLFPTVPSKAMDCNSQGILGAVPGLVGNLQALCALKHILKLPGPTDVLLQWDLNDLTLRTFTLKKSKDCPACAGERGSKGLVSKGQSVRSTCDLADEQNAAIGAAQWASWQGKRWDIRTELERQCFAVASEHIPMQDVLAQLSMCAKDTPVALLCQSGARSERIAAECLHNGWSQVKFVRGGIVALLDKY